MPTIQQLRDSLLKYDGNDTKAYLPGGPPPSVEQMEEQLELPILIGGLDREESWLILSALPQGTQRIYLEPLDKGLSGAKVFSARYDVEDRRVGKAFVVKVGPIGKIDREVEAIENNVLPDIYGVLKPIHRRGITKGLLIQEFAGLSSRSRVKSLREFVRAGGNPEPIIKRLLQERLSNWYKPSRGRHIKTWRYEKLFAWYLSKNGDSPFVPEDWGNVNGWLTDISGCDPTLTQRAASDIAAREYRGISTIVHGDLHCQNVLVDENHMPWPIDFAWCHRDSNPVVDAAMLECSLKYFVIPRRSDPRPLVALERRLSVDEIPATEIHDQPYAGRIGKALRGVAEVRRFALEEMSIRFEDYLRANFLLAWALRGHVGLNQPYLYGSMGVIAQRLGYQQ